MWRPPYRGPRRFPRLDISCLLKVVFDSPESTLHPGTSDCADGSLHLGTAASAGSTLHPSIPCRADSTLHLGITYLVDSHDTTCRVYSHDTAYLADRLDTACTVSTVRSRACGGLKALRARVSRYSRAFF